MKKLTVLILIFAGILLLGFGIGYAIPNIYCAENSAYFSNQTACDADTSCQWNSTVGCITNSSFTQCADISGDNASHAISNCKNESTVNGPCGWLALVEGCVELSEAPFQDQTTCETGGGYWNGSECMGYEFACNDYLDNNQDGYCDSGESTNCGGLGPNGYLITGTSGLEFYLVSDTQKGVWPGASCAVPQNTADVVITAEDADGRAGRLTVNFSAGSVSLSGATIDSDPTGGKSVIYMASWPSEVTNKDLLIPKLGGYTDAYKCPNAQSLSDVNTSCPGKTTGSSTVTISGTNYWLFTGVTGTGGGNNPAPIPEFPGLTIFAATALAFLGMAAITVRYRKK